MGTPSSQSKIPRPILVLPGIGLKAPRYEQLSGLSGRMTRKPLNRLFAGSGSQAGVSSISGAYRSLPVVPR